jgi:hypothetical protein
MLHQSTLPWDNHSINRPAACVAACVAAVDVVCATPATAAAGARSPLWLSPVAQSPALLLQ